LEEFLQADKVLRKLLTGDRGLDFKRYSLLKQILTAYPDDPANLFNLFFPAESVAQKTAEVVGAPYLTYEKLRSFLSQNKISVKNLKVIPGVIYLFAKSKATGEPLCLVFSYYLSKRRIENAVSTREGKTVKKVAHHKISATTYRRIFTDSRLLTPEEFLKKLEQVRKENPEGEVEFLYTELLKQAAYRDASDLHFETSESLGMVRMRTAGALEPFVVLPSQTIETLVNSYLPARVNLSSGLSPNAPRIEDARDSIVLDSGERINIRLAFAPVATANGIKFRLVARLLKMNSSLMSGLEGLGLTPVELELLKSTLRASNGIILTSGPTSSGKSTTLYGLLLNVDWDRKVITIEDPVEFANPYLWTQHQINKKQGLDFEAYIRVVLREDPDVVLIGEIRDYETAKAMVEMANTGHLTLSTVHANNSVDVVKRLTDLGLPLKEVLEYGLIFMAQRLLRKSCPHCRYEGELSKAEAEILGLEKGVKVLRNRGCEKCGGTGARKERVLVIELLPVLKEEVKRMLLEGHSYREIFKELEKEGYKSMVSKALELNRKGEVSLEEILDKIRG